MKLDHRGHKVQPERKDPRAHKAIKAPKEIKAQQALKVRRVFKVRRALLVSPQLEVLSCGLAQPTVVLPPHTRPYLAVGFFVTGRLFQSSEPMLTCMPLLEVGMEQGPVLSIFPTSLQGLL